MAGNKGLTKQERQRRAAQSAKDKQQQRPKQRKSGTNRSTSSRGGSRKLSGSVFGKSGVHPYTKLILDPCHAQLTPSPLPGREGSSVFRLPFRTVVTVPSTTLTTYGGTPASGTGANCSSLGVTLTPSAMLWGDVSTQPAGGASTVSWCANATESNSWTNAQMQTAAVVNNFFGGLDPQGLQQLDSMSALMRPIAGCVKLEFYSGTNTGSFFGYEGVAGSSWFQYIPNNTTPQGYHPAVSGSQLAMMGWSNGIVTEGVEAAVNYAAADENWQRFKQLSNKTTAGSPDAVPYDYSQMPIAYVGVGGATPGTQYLVSGAVVYEWVPQVTFSGSGVTMNHPEVRKQSILDKVIQQVGNYGPMLVGVASKLATGGPSLALSDLFYRMSINNYNGSVSSSGQPPLALGWK